MLTCSSRELTGASVRRSARRKAHSRARHSNSSQAGYTSDAGRLDSLTFQQQAAVKNVGQRAWRSREARLCHVTPENSPRVRLSRTPPPNGVTRRLDTIIMIDSNKEIHPYQPADKSHLPSGNLERL